MRSSRTRAERRVLLEPGERPGAVRRDGDVVALELERLRQVLPERVVVVHDEDAGRGGRSSVGRVHKDRSLVGGKAKAPRRPGPLPGGLAAWRRTAAGPAAARGRTLHGGEEERMTPTERAIAALPPHLRRFVVAQDHAGVHPARPRGLAPRPPPRSPRSSPSARTLATSSGLAATGIDVESIPSLDDMNREAGAGGLGRGGRARVHPAGGLHRAAEPPRARDRGRRPDARARRVHAGAGHRPRERGARAARRGSRPTPSTCAAAARRGSARSRPSRTRRCSRRSGTSRS